MPYCRGYVLKSSEPAESLRKELNEDEPRLEPKLVADRYGTVPRKYLPSRTLPVINKFPVVSIGEGVLTRPLRIVLGGIVLGPTGLPIPGFSIDQLIGEKRDVDNNAAIMKTRFFITQNTSLLPDLVVNDRPTRLYVRVFRVLRLFRPTEFSS